MLDARSRPCKKAPSTYADIIFQLDAPGRVQLDFLQGLSHHIVGLVLALLGGFDGSCLIQITLVVDIKLTESIRQAEDLVLLELRVLPLQLEDVHCG